MGKQRKKRGEWRRKQKQEKRGQRPEKTLLDTLGDGHGSQQLRKGPPSKRPDQAELDIQVGNLIGGQS